MALTREQRQTLINLLLRLPNSGNAAARNMLLADLPTRLRTALVFTNSAAGDIRAIVEAADEWTPDEGETPPIYLVGHAANNWDWVPAYEAQTTHKSGHSSFPTNCGLTH